MSKKKKFKTMNLKYIDLSFLCVCLSYINGTNCTNDDDNGNQKKEAKKKP